MDADWHTALVARRYVRKSVQMPGDDGSALLAELEGDMVLFEAS